MKYSPIDPTDFNTALQEFSGELPQECIADCSASGDVTESVVYWCKALAFDAPREFSISYLRETGGWSIDELNATSDVELSERVLWIICSNRMEEEC